MNQDAEESKKSKFSQILEKVFKRGQSIVELTYFFTGAFAVIAAIYLQIFKQDAAAVVGGDLVRRLSILVLIIFGVLFISIATTNRQFRRLKHTQEWLVNTSLWTVGRIKANGLHCVLNEPGREINSFDPKKWPWGAHHTEQLGHLEAAAQRFWKNYDPSEPDTAPINEMVADWLVKERGVSKDKARAIASILRADGLPAGRR
ncbi:hypothetical protein [Hydrogenophaga defluvii]|uniref:Uncharacterized protein n=1 Tax=Hydrogenophaga defluvii TaxID=249410 RepID=A0ABW2SHC1_9BURK